jgi:hypothetical protein
MNEHELLDFIYEASEKDLELNHKAAAARQSEVSLAVAMGEALSSSSMANQLERLLRNPT